MNTLSNYYDALDRLVANKPKVVPVGSKINKDTVALEASRKRGSIKRSRDVFNQLIGDIENAAAEQSSINTKPAVTIKAIKEDRDKYKRLYLNSLNREVMLNERLLELEAVVNSENVRPI